MKARVTPLMTVVRSTAARVLIGFVLLILMGTSIPAQGMPGHDRAPDGTPPVHGKQAVGLCGTQQGTDKFRCYETLFLHVVADSGVEAAMDLLVVTGVMDPDVQRDGHVFAHAIGIAAYQATHDVGGTFGRCSELFQSGCYHGVIQAYLTEALDEHSMSTERMNLVCEQYRGTSGRWLLFQCLHALGHGLTSYYAHDLPRALRGCDWLHEAWDRHSCYGGAFMENVVHATNPHHPSPSHHHHGTPHASSFMPINPADPLHPCSVLEERYVPDCYQMQTSIILYLNHWDVAAAARTCDTAPLAMRPACYQSLGRDISSYTLQQHDESIRLCSLGSPDYQPWCFVGLVKNFIDLTAKTESGLSFCPRVPGRGNQLKCYEAVGEEIWALASERAQREQWCRMIHGEGEEACRYGARIRLDAPPGIPVAQQR